MLIDFFDNDFEKVKKEDTAILYFSATWCAPCQVQKPIMQKLSESEEFKDKANFYYADIDEKAINTASMSGIRGVPTICILKKGEEVGRNVGSIPESKLKEFLSKHL